LSGIKLVSYDSCADMLAGLRQHAARSVGIWGITPPGVVNAAAGSAGAPELEAVPSAAPPHSTTNDYVAGADEPDMVKTDGNRVITVERGMLRIVDTSTRKITARLQLADPQRTWGASNLLVQGDRALVILSDGRIGEPGGVAAPGQYLRPIAGTRYVLVDLSGQPRVLGTLTPNGQYVDARLIGSTVRLVVRNQPNIVVPQPTGTDSVEQRLARARAAVWQTPISAWLPTYQVHEADGTTSSRTVACGGVRHPADYTGTSMLTVYSIELRRGLADTAPVSLAADGDTVYATTTSLYIASNPQWWYRPVPVPRIQPNGGSEQVPPKMPAQQTEIHRFDVSAPGSPRYVASGKVSGRLLNQYSLSDYDGYLRVATTTGEALADEPGQSSASSTSSSSVYVLRADSLTKVGEVDGLGRGQRIYSVRFIGAVGYVVTFQQMDPLYTLDLRDPGAPRVVGSLELTGYSAYLHPAADGRLIGIGQEATAQGRQLGMQVSLFDVSNPSHPQRLAHLVKTDLQSGAEWDPHAFLYWPQSGTAVLPVNSWTSGTFSGAAMVLTVADSRIILRGSVIQPRAPGFAGQAGITRSLVIGEDLWTVSADGLLVSDLATLSRQAWIPNQ
jgi:Beta propeller domain